MQTFWTRYYTSLEGENGVSLAFSFPLLDALWTETNCHAEFRIFLGTSRQQHD